MTRPTLIVFARAPAIGVGKSRLARDVGRVEAWRLYRGWLAGVLRTLQDPRWQLVVRLAPDQARLCGVETEPQGAGDLGQRLVRAIRSHSLGRVGVVGTDAPEITRADVARAFQGARGGRAVFGPAADGGFWVLALGPREARRITLDGVRWSTGQTMEDTIVSIGRPVVRLRTLVDVDDGAALRVLRAARRRSKPAEPETPRPSGGPPARPTMPG